MGPKQAPDGAYLLTGSSYDKSVNKTYGFFAKIDSSGKVAFHNTFGSGQSREPIFATADGGFFLFGAANTASDILVLKVNSEGIVPGCNFLRSLGTSTRGSYGPLEIKRANITASDDLSLEPLDFGLSSVVTNNPVTAVCQ